MSLVYERVLENVFGVLESPGKVLEIFLNKRVGTLYIACCNEACDGGRLNEQCTGIRQCR